MPHPSNAVSPRKKALRAEMIRRRDAIAAAERARIAERLTAKLAAMPQYREAGSVLATMSIGTEWSTRGFIERALADGKRVVLPRVSEPPRHLELHAVADLARDLKPGIWDIPEPDPARCPKVALSDVDFALVPALAIDLAGFRLGYGAGFFDGLLAGRGERPFCVTALPKEFIIEAVPREDHDVPVDLVISEVS
jgi:5,10-methenyltetrahydrofolate synthetase